MSGLYQIDLLCQTQVADRSIPVSIYLDTLHQTRTYAGLLEGVPTQEMNQRLLQDAIRTATVMFKPAPPFLIPAVQTPIDMGSGRKYPFGTPMALPPIRCIATFNSYFPTREGEGADASTMTLIWYQQEFAMPIDPKVREAIRAIDWLKEATDFEW